MNRAERRRQNISGVFKPNPYDAKVASILITVEKTPIAIQVFDKYHEGLTDYSFWFFLSTLWVSYSGWSDLDLWKKHFGSSRPHRVQSIMKPDEYKAFKAFPGVMTVYRAHRPNETDWIAYTMSDKKAMAFARGRDVNTFKKYRLDKRHVVAYFSRRGESEIICLDKTKPQFVEEIPVAYESSPNVFRTR